MNKTNVQTTGHQVGIFLVLAYIVCLVWYAIHPGMKELHLDSFKLMFLGFTGMNMLSIFLGAVQTYLWGHIAMLLWNVSLKLAGKKE